jgi:hypothetical protein
MIEKIPSEVMRELRRLIYERLDAVDYMCQGRIENGKFMEQLARDPDIGGRIAQYTGKERVKTYIKDAVINRYAKEKTKLPLDLADSVSQAVCEPVQRMSTEKDIELYRTQNGRIIIVSPGRLLKWETALRKLLEYLGRKNEAIGKKSNSPVLLLVLATGGRKVSPSNATLLDRSLAAVGVSAKLL